MWMFPRSWASPIRRSSSRTRSRSAVRRLRLALRLKGRRATVKRGPAWTRDKMIVDEARSLHESVDDRRADEAKAALLQILRQGVGYRCAGGHGFQRSTPMLERRAAHEGPDITVEGAEFALHLQKRLR